MKNRYGKGGKSNDEQAMKTHKLDESMKESRQCAVKMING